MTMLNRQLARLQSWLEQKPVRADLAVVLLLTLLWAFYFWRVLTPGPLNQVSYPEGDFSGQFLAFGAYQAERLLAGEVPLWNPYNYAGHPFIADTQAAVFYPPRLVTILISPITGGWSYAALQAEALAHYWLGGLWMYLFVRSITRSRLAGLVSALTLSYGGYQTGYPPLQLAVLEAGIWLPLVLLGIFRASQPDSAGQAGRWRMNWLGLSALALGLSLLAGHPQTTLFIVYVAAAYTIHRAVRTRTGWLPALLALGGVIGLGFGLAMVQLLPGLEYTRLTIRAGFGFDALAGGFPFSDVIQVLIPNVVTVWSPLYSGIAALALAGVGIWQRRESARFWAVVVLAALGLSFGGATVIYRLAYLVVPGFSWFRGQERAAFVIAHGVAILAGLGTAALLEQRHDSRRLGRALAAGAGLLWALALAIFVTERAQPGTEIADLRNGAFFCAILTTLAWAVIGRAAARLPHAAWSAALIGLIVFDLFSLTWNTNWEPVPAAKRMLYERGLAAHVLAADGLFRVDGRVGLGGNYGTMIGLQDIRGISPLRLNTLEQYLNRLPDYRLYQLLNVRYVFTDWRELEVPSRVAATLPDRQPPIYLHEIAAPTPRAWMTYSVMTAPDEAQALGWLADPAFDPFTTVILAAPPPVDLPAAAPDGWEVRVTEYTPERITLSVSTPADGVLVLGELDYPGWQAAVNGERAPIWRANAGLRALPLAAGSSTVVFTYRPLSVRLGALLSAASLLILLVALGSGWTARRRGGSDV